MDEQQFLQLLQNLLQPNTEVVKQATEQLKKTYYTSPASLTALLQILSSDRPTELRQLAAVQARNLTQKHWEAVPADQKAQIRTSLLHTTLNEPSTLVRHSAARVLSAIASGDLEDGQWTDLPSILQQASASSTVQHREMSMYLLYTLMETFGTVLSDNTTELLGLLGKSLQDPESSEVRTNALLAIGQLVSLIDPEEDPQAVDTFHQVFPSMVQVLKGAVDEGDENKVNQAFAVFQDLLEHDSVFLSKHFGDLVTFMIDLASETSADDEIRSNALAFLQNCVEFRKLKIQGLKLGETLTLKALQITTELGDFTVEDEDIVPGRSALGLLDTLAANLPPSQVVVPLLRAIGPFLNSPNPDYRQAGILALSMCVEGAPDFFSTQLPEIIPAVLKLLADPEPRVRSAALTGVARLADDLAEDMGKEHAKFIPALVGIFDMSYNPNNVGKEDQRTLETIRGCCNAVDSLIEGLEKEDAAKYVAELVPRLSSLFHHPDIKSKMAAASAVGSIAAAGEDAFIPFFEQTMQTLAPFVQVKEGQEELELRSIVCDAMGNIASAVGSAPFQQYVAPLMQASEEALHLDHARLRETSYIHWSTMAKLYEEEFSPYLNGVVQALLECLEQDEIEEVELGEDAQDLLGAEVTIGGKKVKVASLNDDDDDDDLLGDDDGDDSFDDLAAVSAVAGEKEIAAEVLGDVLSATKRQFIPHLQKTVETLLKLVDHPFEGVRKACISTLWRAYATLWTQAETEGMAKWQPGVPLQIQPPEEILKLGNLVMTATLNALTTEMDRSTVSDINRNLSATLRHCGPSVLMAKEKTVVPQLAQELLLILTKQHPCQIEGDEEDGLEALEESSEYDWLVIDTALDVLTCLSAALGAGFGEVWKMFEKPVLKYASSQESIERASAVGSIAECIGNMGEAVTPYTVRLMKVIVHRLSDEDTEAKSNAAYAAGLLCEKSSNEQEVLSNYPTILRKLESLLDNSAGPRILDNALGCVSRMIARHPGQIPLQDVLPRLIELLPLKVDFEENKPIYRMIIGLYRAQDATIQQLTPNLMPIFQHVLSPPEEQLDAETRQQLTELVKYIQSQ